MKKLIALFLIVFFFLSFRNTTVYAWPNFDFDFKMPDFSFPTISIPTISIPTSTPTPNPTLTPSPTNNPTETPILIPTTTPLISSPTPEPKEEEETLTVSPTEKPQEEKSLLQKDFIYAGIAGLLILIILVQAWPKIRKFLHEKTA